MLVKPDNIKQLVALKDGKVFPIDSMVMRKTYNFNDQEKHLVPNSLCIVCDYRFYEKKIKWSDKIKAICHPFRDDSIFPKNINKYLFSESDFCSKHLTPISSKSTVFTGIKYDFVYFTLFSLQGIRCKGLYMLEIIDKAARSLGINGLVVDYDVKDSKKYTEPIYTESLDKVKNSLASLSNLRIVKRHCTQDEVCSVMKVSKFVMMPSTSDASPRLLVESIVRGVPVLVNSHIYGGWKYITENTGVFFDGLSLNDYFNNNKSKFNEATDSLIQAMSSVLRNPPDTELGMKIYYKKYGFYNAAKTLATIVNESTGMNYEMVAFKEWRSLLKRKS